VIIALFSKRLSTWLSLPSPSPHHREILISQPCLTHNPQITGQKRQPPHFHRVRDVFLPKKCANGMNFPNKTTHNKMAKMAKMAKIVCVFL